MENKTAIEAISKQIEIVKTKIFVFSAGFGGAWLFMSSNYTRMDFLVFVSIFALMVFALGVSINMTRLTKLYNELEAKKDTNGSN